MTTRRPTPLAFIIALLPCLGLLFALPGCLHESEDSGDLGQEDALRANQEIDQQVQALIEESRKIQE